MNVILQEKERNNQLLEQQLKALKEGKIPEGPDGLAAIRQFESLLQAIPEIEKQVFDGTAQMSEQEREEKEKQKKQKFKNDILVNPIKLSQNQLRSGALDRGEKALINLQAQEYDQLRMVNSFKPEEQKDELYQFKLKQYKELSAIRHEQLKEINTQKIARLRGRFLNDGNEQDLKLHRQEFNDMVERTAVARRIEAIKQMPVPQQYQEAEDYEGAADSSKGAQEDLRKRRRQRQQQAEGDGNQQHQSDGTSIRTGQDILPEYDADKNSAVSSGTYAPARDYDPLDGFNFYFDYVSKLFDAFNGMRFVFGIYNINDSVIDPLMIDSTPAEPDATNVQGQPKMNMVLFKKSNVLKGILAHPMANFVVELQVPKSTYENNVWVSYGWTILNVFSLKRELNSGQWKLPLYQSPVQASIDTRDLNTLIRIPQTVFMMRIVNSRVGFDMKIKEHDIKEGSRPLDYKIPECHNISKFITEQDLLDDANAHDAAIDDSSDSDEEIAPDLQYASQGATILISSIHHYIPPSSTTIITTLYKGGEIVKKRDNTDCQFETTAKDYDNVKDELAGKKKSKLFADDKAFGRYLKINEQSRWEQNFHKILKSDIKKQEMTLVLYIYETFNEDIDMGADNKSDDSKRALNNAFSIEERNEKKKLHGYAVMKINNADHTLKYGNYDLNVFRPPINLRKRYTKDLINKEVIKISIRMPDDDEAPSSDEASAKEDDSDEEDEVKVVVKEVPFIESKRIQVNKEQFYKKGDGVDIYIDQARYLPDSVTFTRLLIRGLNKTQTKVMNAFKCFSDVNDSTRMVQDYLFRFEARPDGMIQKKPSLDPTTFLEIMIETIDRSDMNEKIVGFAYFPLFLALDGDQLPYDSNVEEFLFNEGCHQMPIYYDRVAQGELKKEVIQSLPKVFTSTLTIRAYKAPRGAGSKVLSLEDNRHLDEKELIDKKIIREPPLYGAGVYNNNWCQMERNEQHLFKYKHKRFNPTMAQTAGYLFNRKGIVAPQNESLEKVLSLLDNLFGKPSLFKQKLDKKYENSYEPIFGFRLSVTRLHGLMPSQNEKIHFVVTSMIPPGRLLQAEPSMGPDVHVFKDQDFESKWDSVQFDEEMNYVGLPGKDKLGILFEVKAYNPKLTKQKNIQSVGWAYLPLFQTVENENKSYSIFTNQGLVQLPLFGGPVEKSILISALKSEDPINALYMDKELTMLDTTSIIARIHDNQTFFVPEKTDYSDLNTDYLFGKDLQKYFFNEEANEKSKSDTLKATHYNLKEEDHLKTVKESLRIEYGFNYPKI